MQDDLIGSVEACQILGIDRGTLSRWINHREPKLTPALKLPGSNGALLFHRADVQQVAASRRVPAA